jgi:ABC-type transport system involved in multi-copper enzyme maturation permease subunit
MWNLIRKDVVLGRRTLIVNGSLALVAPFILLMPDEPPPVILYVLYVGLLCTMLPVSLIAKEEKFSATAFTCSLPVTRRDIVTSRYVGGWFIAGGWMAVVLAVGLTAPAVRDLWSGGGGGALLAGFAMLGLAMAIVVPFTIRFGMNGLLFGLVGLQVLGMALFLVALATGGLDGIERAVETVVDAVGGYHERVGPAGFAATVIFGVALLNWASWRASLRIFRTRDL